jgi:hypothetical protein
MSQQDTYTCSNCNQDFPTHTHIIWYFDYQNYTKCKDCDTRLCKECNFLICKKCGICYKCCTYMNDLNMCRPCTELQLYTMTMIMNERNNKN